MQHVSAMEQERQVLRWGGLAGVAGSVLFILVFIIVATFVGMDSATSATAGEWIERFPDIRAARTVENSLYLVVLVLWAVHYLTLYRLLRTTGLAPALFGSALGVLGLVMLMAGALPHIATLPLSDLYHASGATVEERASLVLMWDATQGIFDALLITGLVILPLAHILIGLAMLGSPAFGKWIGRMGVGLGVAGTAAACVLLIDPASTIAIVSVIGAIAFHGVVGWTIRRQSNVPEPGFLAPEHAIA